MVNLFFEIKRKLPSDQQVGMKLSAPNIGELMIDLYRTTNDEQLKVLVEIFLERAGEDWLQSAKRTGLGATLIKSLMPTNQGAISGSSDTPSVNKKDK